MNHDEYESLVQRAGMADFSARTRIEIRGKDRVIFLHNLCTNEVKKRSPGDVFEAFFCNARGKIVGYGTLIMRPNSILLESTAGQTERLMSHLDRYIIREDVQLRDISAEWLELLVAGPLARKTLADITGQAFEASPLGNLTCGIQGREVLVAESTYAGPDSFLLFFPTDGRDDVESALTSAGVETLGPETIEAARIEAATPLYGIDITDDTLPQEVARDRVAISLVKGCYLGQETVARIDALGHVNRQLTLCRFDATQVPTAGLELTANGKSAGNVTSAAFSHRHNAPLALAYVRRDHLAHGSKLDSEIGSLTVVGTPIMNGPN